MYKKYIISVLMLFCYQTTSSLMMNQHDVNPLYSQEYPWSFLDTNLKETEKNPEAERIEEKTHFSVACISQKATTGTNNLKTDVTNLGDLHGPWSMIGLLYGDVPQGQTQPTQLIAAAVETFQDGKTLDYLNYRDINNHLGFFSVPLKYRKVGMRFEWSQRFMHSFVFTLQTGFADIKQTAGTLSDLSGSWTVPSDVYGKGTAITNINPDILTVQEALMDQSQQIFDQLGYNTRNCNKTGAEDVFVSVTWREHFHINKSQPSEEWSTFTIIPFFTLKGCLGFGKEKEPNALFDLPFGNDGHHGIQIAGGFSLDFKDTVEVSVRGSGTHFYKRNIAGMFVPTSKAQSGIYPYKTDVQREPGRTWEFAVGCNSHYFLDKVSMHAEYVYIQHAKDSITLKTPDNAFVPSVLEDFTAFNIQTINVGFAYDLSANISIGGVWQCPITQRNAYKTNSFLLNILVTL